MPPKRDDWTSAEVIEIGEEFGTAKLDNGETTLIHVEDYERAYGKIAIGQKLVRKDGLLILEGFIT